MLFKLKCFKLKTDQYQFIHNLTTPPPVRITRVPQIQNYLLAILAIILKITGLSVNLFVHIE